MHAEQVTPFTPPTAVPGQPASYSGAVNALILAGHALVDGGQAINAEQLAFWQSRLKEDLATCQRLLECGSAQNAWQIQLEYAQSALQAYVDQSTKVAALIAHALTDSLLPKMPGATPSRSTTALAA